MGARLDYSLEGGESYGNWDADTWKVPVWRDESPTPASGDIWSFGGSLLGGYLSRRMDLDIAQRAQGLQPMTSIRTTQPPLSTRRSMQGDSVTLQSLAPLALIGLVVYLALKG